VDGNGRGQPCRADVVILRNNNIILYIRLNVQNTYNVGKCFLAVSKVHSKYTYCAFHLVVKLCTNNDETFGRWRVTVLMLLINGRWCRQLWRTIVF